MFIHCNSYPAEFLKWNYPPSISGTVRGIFREIKMRTRSWLASSIGLVSLHITRLHGCAD